MLPMPDDLPSPSLSSTAQTVMEKRYLLKNTDGLPLETPAGLFWRVAACMAQEEVKYGASEAEVLKTALQFHNLMASLKFLPNSPTLMNAGTAMGQLAACFVLPVGDSIEEIFDAVKHAALIHKSGGGTGFSFSRLRPKNSLVGATGGIASGPLSFLKIFDTATEQIKQGGRRRGANMGILRIDHPDIIEFIRAKEQDGEFSNFNFSVALTETFMRAVEEGARYELVDPHTGLATGSQDAREIFRLLASKAWQSGDPGIIFIDRVNAANPTPQAGPIEATNPCGEQPLLPYEACNLGSINLARFHAPAASAHQKSEDINWEDLKDAVHTAVHFLDNVIDASAYPLPQIADMARANRKIGLGVMGFADLLYQLSIPYNSEKAVALADKIMAFINTEARAASRCLAEHRGPFPAYESSVFPKKGQGPYRNATVTTIAPTGTLSILAGCSSGIEPVFALRMTRKVMDGENFYEINPYFAKALEDVSLDSKSFLEQTGQESILDSGLLPGNLRQVFVTAMDIEPLWHLKMQAAFQRHTDNAVSKTVNLPTSATEQNVHDIYWQAWKLGCKGVTVYRDGSKSSQVLTAAGKAPSQKSASAMGEVRKRPEVINGFTRKVQTGLGVMYLTVNEVEGRPFEVFATIGKSGRSITAKAEAIGRLVSLALRSGVAVRDIVDQIKGIGGEHPVFREKGLLLSIPDAIAWVLENRYLQNEPLKQDKRMNNDICPECGASLLSQEGCMLCPQCGYSKCG